jgi:hypothetical protein
METLLDRVIWRGKTLTGNENEETCRVMTRRQRWLFFTRSRTTVLPTSDCDSSPGFIVWWNSNDPAVLGPVHKRMVEIIGRIGFIEPAVWCESRLTNRSPTALGNFWRDQLGDLFRYYRKAT